MGPNGAGKTTLINVLTGFQPVGTGTVELEGETLNGIAAHMLRRKGVARTFQSGRLFRDLPVMDNLEVTGVGLGQRPTRRDRRGRTGHGLARHFTSCQHHCRRAALHGRAPRRHRPRDHVHAAVSAAR
ncbi:ATP-binding cassette domain-containing protein [Bradyrhizobium sp. I1.14.4]|uniref:ATP-binding cassette domain-containing protein n=1 Tax=unclassified Bradyrhizobium TaxID=2631580 RepID=UPI003D25A9E5